jgi:hypothetical protein
VADAAPAEKLAEAVPELSVRRAKEKLEDLHHRSRIGRVGEGKRGDPHRYYAFYPQDHHDQDPAFPAAGETPPQETVEIDPTRDGSDAPSAVPAVAEISAFPAEFPADPTYKEESAPNPISEFPADDFSQETQESLPSGTAPEFLATGGPPYRGDTPPSAGNVSGGADRSGRDKADGLGGSADVAAAPDPPMPAAVDALAHAAPDLPAVTGSAPKRSRDTGPDQLEPGIRL